MSQSENRHPILLRDLGRPTRRGIRKCHKCGTVTGTRGRACKNPVCDVVFREGGKKKKLTSDEGACRIALQSEQCRVYSIRTSHRGPECRTFVQLPLLQSNICFSTTTASSQPSSLRSMCCLEACIGNKAHCCTHIKAAEKCSRNSQKVCITESVLSTINIPSETKQVLSGLVCRLGDLVVQRCSSQAFVVNCGMASSHSFGCCHVLFLKANKDGGSNEQRFLCSCQPSKSIRRPSTHGEDSDCDSSNKYCLHYYACICAFASNEELSTEFRSFLTGSFEAYSATILSGLHLSSAARNNSENREELEHPTEMSVEIIGENFSLLEGITAVDDSSSEIQSVHCPLSEHTLTSTDDTLSFGDSSTLDSLDESDPHCSADLPEISEILVPTTQNSHECEMLDSTEIQSGLEEEEKTESQINQQNGMSQQYSSDSQAARTKSLKCMRKKFTVLERTTPSQPQSTLGEKSHSLSEEIKNSSNGDELEKESDLEKLILKRNFEKWIAVFNARMNAAMNYQLPETCSIVDYVAHETFEFLRERIVSVCKRKCQGMLICRKDKPPVGSFKKYVWDILSVRQLMNVFQSNQVPLKLSQFFVQTASGMHMEWTPTKDEEKSHRQQILPVLHCTKIKVGKLDNKEKEVTPFVIEWIPQILPGVSVGELSINFAVTHTGPIHTEDERKACIAPIQRHIQQSKALSPYMTS